MAKQASVRGKAVLFVTIPKKGDTMKCENNRTIALICHASKVLLKIVAQRMKVKLKEEIAEEQAGSISEQGTRNQIMNVKLIIESTENTRRHYTSALSTIVKHLIQSHTASYGKSCARWDFHCSY